MTRFPRAVRFRITVLHTAVFALLFTVFGIGLYYGLRSLTFSDVDSQLARRARLLLPELVIVNGEPMLREAMEDAGRRMQMDMELLPPPPPGLEAPESRLPAPTTWQVSF